MFCCIICFFHVDIPILSNCFVQILINIKSVPRHADRPVRIGYVRTRLRVQIQFLKGGVTAMAKKQTEILCKNSFKSAERERKEVFTALCACMIRALERAQTY